MRLGIFAKTFVRPTLAEVFDAVAARGIDCIQFNFACAGLPSMPDKIPPSLAAQIGQEARQRKLAIAAVSGTFNMIDPDAEKRRAGLRRLEEIAASCAAMGAPLVTLCTGTRDPQDIWRRHPDNDLAGAWEDLLKSMEAALKIAARHKICLGVEPETGNVVSTAARARQLLDEMQSPHLKIIIDASNLFHPGETRRKEDVMTEAFELLGPDIALAHAKDFRAAEEMEYVAPGKGELPWAHYLRLLRTVGFYGSLVMHGLAEPEVDGSAAFLRKQMVSADRPARIPISSEFFRDGITFNYQDVGRGIPFFYQHGLGGSVNQTFDLFHPPAGFRMISMDCRGHGLTRPLGSPEKLSVSTFADDLLALMDHLGISRAIIGGISMGAALSLNFAVRHPERVCGLILQRPAWLDHPRHDNVGIYPLMARLIRGHGPEKGLELFKQTPEFQRIFKQSPLGAKSLIAHFLDPRAVQAVDLIERIPLDSPHPDRAQWRQVNVPTLVLANRQDEVHPFEFGEAMAKEIPGAEFHELTPKAVSLEKHNAGVQQYLDAFLLHHF